MPLPPIPNSRQEAFSSTRIAAIIKRARELLKGRNFARALELLQIGQRDLARTLQINEKSSIQREMSNIYLCWGQSEEDRLDYKSALNKYLAALNIDKDQSESRTIYAIYKTSKLYLLMNDRNSAMDYIYKGLKLDCKNLDYKKAYIFFALGLAYEDKNWHEKAIQYFEEAILMFRRIGDKLGEARVNIALGTTYSWDTEKALIHLKNASVLSKGADSLIDELTIYKQLGALYGNNGQFDKSIRYLNQARSLARQGKEELQEAGVLWELGRKFSQKGDNVKAIGCYKEVLSIYKKYNILSRQAGILNQLGLSYGEIKEYKTAIDFLTESMKKYKQINDETGESGAGINLGNIYQAIGDIEKEKQFNKGLRIKPYEADDWDIAKNIHEFGIDWDSRGEHSTAINKFKEALSECKKHYNPYREASVLISLSKTYQKLGRASESRAILHQALMITTQSHDLPVKCEVLSEMASVSADSGDLSKSIEYLNMTLLISKRSKLKFEELRTLVYLGDVYFELGDYEKALKYYNTVWVDFKDLRNDDDIKPSIIGRIGNVYFYLGDGKAALRHFNQARSLLEKKDRRSDTAECLYSIGKTYYLMGEQAKALQFLDAAIGEFEYFNDIPSLAKAYVYKAKVYEKKEDKNKAIENYYTSVVFMSESENINDQSKMLSFVSEAKYNKNRNIAIYFGKISINIRQESKNKLDKLDYFSRQSFNTSSQSTYNKLIYDMIQCKRINEALHVYLIKYYQNETDGIRTNKPIICEENQLEEKMKNEQLGLNKKIMQISNRILKIRGNIESKEDKKEDLVNIDKLETELVNSREELMLFLNRLEGGFKGQQPQMLRESKLVSEFYKAFAVLKEQTGQCNITVLTLLMEDKLVYLLIRDGKTLLREIPVPRADIEKKIDDFRIALTKTDSQGRPAHEPKPLAQQLYNLLVKPIEKDVVGCPEVFWGLDGKLRYIPLAALHDGKKYLVEKEQRNLLFIAESVGVLSRKPSPTRKILGCSTSHRNVVEGEDFVALFNVPSEMDAIRPTRWLADKKFTRGALIAGLKEKPSIVHLATHFSLKPGNIYNSYLLLGDGTPLRMNDVNDLPDDLFAGVDLLTLSACETGAGMTTANGAELESFGYLAQRKGAAAVLSTLWSVNDASTAALMKRFYGSLGKVGPGGKAEALRLAQLALLTGKDNPVPRPGKPMAEKRGPLLGNAPTKIDAPLYKPGPKAPRYEHPYYWAPFTLLGNPR